MRQVAMLGLVLCAVGLVLVFPARSYLAQQAELRQQQAVEAAMRAQLGALQQQKQALSDPDYVRREARERLQYVQPGETVYQVPAGTRPAAAPAAPAPAAADSPWYAQLWASVSAPGTVPAR